MSAAQLRAGARPVQLVRLSVASSVVWPVALSAAPGACWEYTGIVTTVTIVTTAAIIGSWSDDPAGAGSALHYRQQTLQ